MKESPESLPGSAFVLFKEHLGSVLARVERRKTQLDTLTNLYEFYDSVSVRDIALRFRGLTLSPEVLGSNSNVCS